MSLNPVSCVLLLTCKSSLSPLFCQLIVLFPTTRSHHDHALQNGGVRTECSSLSSIINLVFCVFGTTPTVSLRTVPSLQHF
uniref:Putative secreted peptide n=1 Tax=Anopheles braziliensis TaxID=58242 RepID=A0A2M3ZV36_9DIPT